MTAHHIISEIEGMASDSQREKNERFFRENDGYTETLGVAFGKVFKTAKNHSEMPLAGVRKLLNNKYYEIRMAAMAILDFKARKKSQTEKGRKALFDFYLKNHHRINNWDFVDRAAWRVVGNYLLDKDRSILYQLARSHNPWKKRTAIVSTYAFIRKGEVEDTFNIAEILLDDPFDLTQRAVGTWVREAGKKSPEKLLAFLDKHASGMSAISLRYAVEKLEKDQKNRIMAIRKNKSSGFNGVSDPENHRNRD